LASRQSVERRGPPRHSSRASPSPSGTVFAHHRRWSRHSDGDLPLTGRHDRAIHAAAPVGTKQTFACMIPTSALGQLQTLPVGRCRRCHSVSSGRLWPKRCAQNPAKFRRLLNRVWRYGSAPRNDGREQAMAEPGRARARNNPVVPARAMVPPRAIAARAALAHDKTRRSR
jgi:hypothetical protein